MCLNVFNQLNHTMGKTYKEIRIRMYPQIENINKEKEKFIVIPKTTLSGISKAADTMITDFILYC